MSRSFFVGAFSFLLVVFPLAFAVEYDLTLHITASENFTLFESNPYKVIVKNNGTADDEINITILRTIFLNGSAVYMMSGNYSLKKSVTKTFQWTPQEYGNYTLCANITSCSANDTNPLNDGECRNVYVPNISADENGTYENDSVVLTNFTCDLGVRVSAGKFLFDSKEPLGIKIMIDDVNHSGVEHLFSLAYWIEDLFGNVVKSRYESTYSINLSETRTYNPQAPEIGDSEAYLVKTEITDPGCNDTNIENNYNENLFLVKGLLPDNGNGSGAESRIDIIDVSPERTTFGDIIYVSVDAYRGDTSKYSLSLWVERPDDGFDVSEKSTVHLKNKNTEYSLKIPVVIKPNCDGRYKDGGYDIIADGLGAGEIKTVTLSGTSSSLCKTKTVTKYKVKPEPKVKEKTEESDAEKIESVPDVEFWFLSWKENVSFGEEFVSAVSLSNNKDTILNVSVYSYVIFGMTRLSEGLSPDGWKKSWTGNEKELLINPGDSVTVNLTNRIQKNIVGNYTLKVKMTGDVERVLERGITINAPVSLGDGLSVSCNATDKKTYLFLRNNASEDVSAVVSSYGRPRSRREIVIESGKEKYMAYFGMVDKFVVEYEGGTIECVAEIKADAEVDEREYRLPEKAVLQTTTLRNGSIAERFVGRLYSFFRRG